MRKSTVTVQKITILLPVDLVRAARIRAAKRSGPGRRSTLTQAVIDALRVYAKARD